MKKVFIALIITGSVLLTAGGVIAAIGYANGQGIKTETKEYKDLEAFENFNINLGVSELEIKPSTDSTRKVIVDETKYDQHEVEVKDNTLFVKGVNKRKWYEYVFTWSFFNKIKVTVYVPEGTYNNFKVTTSTGAIVVPENYEFASFTAKSSTGSVRSKATVVNEIVVETSTGSINLEGTNAKSMSLKSSTGSINLKNLEVSETITANSGTGSTNLENVKCNDFNSNASTGTARLTNTLVTNHIEIKRSTGSVKLTDSDADSLYIKTSTGSVNLTLLSEKRFVATSSTGSIKVPSTTSGGICEIHTSTGSIRAEIKAIA